MGMLFRELAVRLLMVAMLGPMVGASDELPICAPPAPQCPIFKRSVCEWSASGEPLWACKGYFEAANTRRPIIDGGRNFVNDGVDSTTDGDVMLGAYEYHIPQGRQLISHHEPKVKIGTYTYPVPSKTRIADEEPDTILHTGEFTYPVPSRKVTVEGGSDTTLHTVTHTSQLPNKKRSAEEESGTILHTGTYTYPLTSRKVAVVGGSDSILQTGRNTSQEPSKNRSAEEEPDPILHTGTYTYTVPSREVTVQGRFDTILPSETQAYQVSSKKRSAEEESDTILHNGMYTYPVPSRKVIVEGGPNIILRTGPHNNQEPSKKRSAEEEPDTILHTEMYVYPASSKSRTAKEENIIWSAGTQPLPVAPQKLAVGESKIINQTVTSYTSPMAPQIAEAEESDPIVITETYTLPVSHQIVREGESDAKVLIGTNTYGIPSNQKSWNSKKLVDPKAEIIHTLAQQKVSGEESDSIQHSGTYTLPEAPQNASSTGFLSEANAQVRMKTHGVSSSSIQVDSKPKIINNPPVPMVHRDSSPEVEYGIVEYDAPSEKRSSLFKFASQSDVKVGSRVASVDSSVQIPHEFGIQIGTQTHQYPSKQKTLESDSTALFRTHVLPVPVGRKRDELDQINLGTMLYQAPFKKSDSAAKEVSGSEVNEGRPISDPVQVDSVVVQGKPESEARYGTFDYIVRPEEMSLSLKSEPETSGKSKTYNLLSGRRNGDYRSTDPELDIIDVDAYGIPFKSKVPSGPNASAELNSFRLGTLAYSNASGKVEAGSTNLGSSSEVQQNWQPDGSAIDPIISDKESTYDSALHAKGGIHEMPILSARNDETYNAQPGIGVDAIEAIDGFRKNMATADVSGPTNAHLRSLQSDDMGSTSGSRSVNLNQKTVGSSEIVGPSSSTGDSQTDIKEHAMANAGRASSLTNQQLQHYVNAANYQQYPSASVEGTDSAHQTLNYAGGFGAPYGYGYPSYGHGGYRLPAPGATGQVAGLASGVYHPWPQPWAPLFGYRNPFLVGKDAPLQLNPILHGRMPKSSVPIALPYYGARSLNSEPNSFGAQSQNPESDDHGSSNSLVRISSAYYPPSTQNAGINNEFQYDICAFCKSLISLMRQLLSAPSSGVCIKIEPLFQEFIKYVFEVWGNRFTNNAS